MTAPAVTSGSPPYFQVHTRADVYFGKNLTTSGSGMRPGHLVTLDTGGMTVTLCAQSGSPFGQLLGARSLVYTPLDYPYAVGEYVNVVQGDYISLVSAFFWDTGAIPANAQSDSAIFTAANGLMSLTAGGTPIGRFIRQKNVTQLGGQVAVALCRMNISPVT